MWFVFAVLLLAFLVVFVFSKRFAIGVVFVSAGVFSMAGGGAAGGLFPDPNAPVFLRSVTLDETPRVVMQAGLQIRPLNVPFGLTTAGFRAKTLSIRMHWNDLAELREHIKYELRRENITAERGMVLNHLLDQIELEVSEDVAVGQVAVQHEDQQPILVELVERQSKLNETLVDTANLVKVLGSVSRREFAGTFIAAKIQVVRLLAEKAAVDGSIEEIRESMKRPKAG
ncbi:MAG: hypothetical protein ABI705_02080 [Aestuariivirga sp.]